MCKILILLLYVPACGISARAQASRFRDSVASELHRVVAVVRVLRNAADHQDTLFESAKQMVEMLAASRDSATNGLIGWRLIFDRESTRFDSILTRLDSAVGAVNTLTHKLDSIDSTKGQKKFDKD